MKKIIVFVLVILGSKCFAQQPFSNCSAAFLGDKMVVKNYSATEKAKISIKAKGDLTASTAEIGKNYSKSVNKFPFGIAIKDKNTGTLMLFSKETFMKIDVQKVLAKCKKGDSIVLLTLSNEYALPHNEILVE